MFAFEHRFCPHEALLPRVNHRRLLFFCIYPIYYDTSPLRSMLSASVSARFDTIHTQECRGRHFNFLPLLPRQIYAYACFRACKLSPSRLCAYFLTLFCVLQYLFDATLNRLLSRCLQVSRMSLHVTCATILKIMTTYDGKPR